MKFSKIFFTLAWTTLTLMSCSDNREAGNSDPAMSADHASHMDDPGHDHSQGDTTNAVMEEYKKPEGLYLNRGRKWEVNPEMRPFITGAERWLDKQLVEGNMDPEFLAKGLKNYNDQLIQACTMEGESHEVLHKWLHPHMALVDDLSKAEGKEQTEKVVASVMRSFSLYHRYFE